MSAARGYDDPCGAARALSVVGERWALLTIRELLFGPKRFGQLRAGLHGISPNVLSERLRELESAGVVLHEILPPPASVAVYSLTPRGHALEPVLIELGRWGNQQPITSHGELGTDALALALKATYTPTHTTRDAVYALGLGDDWFHVEVANGALDVRRGHPSLCTTTINGSTNTIRAFAFGRLSLDEAENDGQLDIRGSRGAARRFPKLFHAPAPRPSETGRG
ncbi:MAG: helix-turn-helix transcriptional regulator [Actinomycetota bacterium]|nr:helix-turn-helix transcriptional regulator [Actinomycetota bacterium]